MIDLALLVSVLAVTIQAGTSLVFAAVGEIYTERAGILNLGLEGTLIMGAVSAFAVGYHTESLLLGTLAAIVVGAALASIHAFLSVTLRADQVVSGLALTLFGIGLSSFLGQRLGPEGAPLVGLVGPKFTKIEIAGLSQIPLLGPALFNQDLLVYLMYLSVPVAAYLLYRTRIGLNVRAVGEDPDTADAMGISVTRTRYLATVGGGMMMGLGGAHLSLAYTPGWTENLTGGRGWIAIALVIFATWDPARALLGALIFGGVNAIQFRLQAAGGGVVPAAVLAMMPYLLTVVVLTLITVYENVSRRLGAPAALGLPYMRGER
ncbi:MAG: ABC transporter permease [Caldilineaceae bacterium]|nr:ABC transporter permease [Caldilineaceae bacterium]MCY4090335.1 ABC transporter permease [Caldilineaceae bacterium]MCY4119187.1 ABC transporter permease [Caldilineaceae bacterium]MDE0069479.1 ABC transporter permease [Caldilineaceae bacterium]MDE0183725.1 ABC transporter permease [Caldilineaceae bacterium]